MISTTMPVMMDHFGYFSRHYFVWYFWDSSLVEEIMAKDPLIKRYM